MVHDGFYLCDRPEIFLLGFPNDFERGVSEHELTYVVLLALLVVRTQMLGY